MHYPPTRDEVLPSEELVWDYPRPPRLEASSSYIEVYFGNAKIADTRRAFRVLETSHPPVYYIAPEDIATEFLTATPRSTICEWKGKATYYSVSVADKLARDAAWCYLQPRPEFAGMAGYVAFYPALMDRCLVDGEEVVPQPGAFYGGWITQRIKGPFKGEPGTSGW